MKAEGVLEHHPSDAMLLWCQRLGSQPRQVFLLEASQTASNPASTSSKTPRASRPAATNRRSTISPLSTSSFCADEPDTLSRRRECGILVSLRSLGIHLRQPSVSLGSPQLDCGLGVGCNGSFLLWFVMQCLCKPSRLFQSFRSSKSFPKSLSFWSLSSLGLGLIKGVAVC